MKLVVIIPTLGRSGQVARLLAHLGKQKRLPDEVIISAPDATHVELLECRFPVRTVFGKMGLAAQRNTALEHALGQFDIITYFDDDFVPANDYLDRIVAEFEKHPDRAVVMGRVVRDGATNEGLNWDDALLALRQSEAEMPPDPQVVDHVGAYGCNMSMRAAMIGNLRFDERLVLYGWQEDIDFTSQMRSRGRVVGVSSIRGVHLGMKAGRVSGERFGYSQVANAVYLVRKGTVPASFALPLMGRNIAANVARSIWPESYVDRRGRLRGNLLAIAHVLLGRVEPEYILKL
jgi:glycosyltransferase involved in cell wall biosynthesis